MPGGWSTCSATRHSAEVWPDTASGSPAVVVAYFILLARPVIYGVSAMLLNQSLMPNVGTIVRWRSHRHVLRQSVGWFQNDFAGRIANRMMQTAPAVGEVAGPGVRRDRLCGPCT